MTEIEMYKNYLKKLSQDKEWLTFVDKTTVEFNDFERVKK
jgi:hypothetical protein